nr:MAG TPA: hypothetical protein [Caudoviricetes sp.]
MAFHKEIICSIMEKILPFIDVFFPSWKRSFSTSKAFLNFAL